MQHPAIERAAQRMEKTSYTPVASQDHGASSESLTTELESFQPPGSVRHGRRRSIWTLLASGVALVVYTAAVMFLSTRKPVQDEAYGGRIIRSPASEYLQHEIREVDYLDWDKSAAFFGEPSKTVDSNWHRLVQYHNIGLPKSYMDEIGRVYQGVRFPDGRYFGSLMVYHHLHCLKHIYHALHPEYYADVHPGAGQEEEFRKHTEHCLGALKEYVMCKADVTVETMLWSPKHSMPLHNVTSTHQCANWDSIEDYMKANNEDVFADGMLVHPTYGPVYKDRKPLNVF